jgi:hypothetical protein
MVSCAAPRLACMWGRATLAMVMSRMTMIIATITEVVRRPR